MDLQSCKSESTTKDGSYVYLLADPIIAKIFVAILVSTIAMATLEPCLPLWLMATMKPEVNFFSKIVFRMDVCQYLNSM